MSVARRGRREIITPAAGMRIETQKTFVLFLKRTHELHEQRMLHHVGEIPRVIMVTVVHAATGTFTTTLRTNIGAPAATSGRWPSIG